MTAPRNIGFTVNHKYRLTCLRPSNAHLLPQLPGLRAQMPITWCFSLYESSVSANLKVDCYGVQQFVIIGANVHFDVRWFCVFEQRQARYANPQRLLGPIAEV
jgi:hypothetical protein